MAKYQISPETETLLDDINKAAHAAGTNAWVRDVLKRAHRAVRKSDLAPTPDLWRPFKTAPKDGTPFLCWCPDDTFQPITGVDLIWWETSLRDWTGDGDKPYAPLNRPALWRPLPALPQGPDTSTDRLQKLEDDAFRGGLSDEAYVAVTSPVRDISYCGRAGGNCQCTSIEECPRAFAQLNQE